MLSNAEREFREIGTFTLRDSSYYRPNDELAFYRSHFILTLEPAILSTEEFRVSGYPNFLSHGSYKEWRGHSFSFNSTILIEEGVSSGSLYKSMFNSSAVSR